MIEQTPMRALIRKDARIIFPLLVIGWISCLFCNLLLFLVWQYYWETDTRSLFSGSMTLWVLIPGLVSFGAAAMLIGTEEDSRTLMWLRTLPVSWRHIALSKFMVGVGAYVSVWLLASLILWLLSHGWRGVASPFGYSHLSYQEGSIALFIQLLLLLLGFVVSYGIRTPVAGLLTLIPVFVIVLAGFTFAIEQFVLEKPGVLSPAAYATGACFLILIGFVQHALASRRLTRPDSSRWGLSQGSLSHSSHYRPPLLGISSKPSPAASLLWQQCRQTAPAGMAMVGVSLLLTLLSVVSGKVSRDLDYPSGGLLLISMAGLAPMFVTLSASWLGAITFYADNQRRRYAFFADRGISPTKVWWTRIVPPMIGCLVLAVAVPALGYSLDGGGPGDRWTRDGVTVSLIVTLFAFGQLVSQWIERPILAFLAAPAYSFACLTPTFMFLDAFRAPFTMIVLSVPILLLASWRLTKHWLEGRSKAVYAAHVLGYTLLAVAMPCVLYAAVQIFTIALQL